MANTRTRKINQNIELNTNYDFVANDGTFSGTVTGNSFVGPLEGNVTGEVSSLSNHDTSDLDEGTNLYFTTARARGAFSEGTGVSITNGAIAIGQAVNTNSDVTFGSVDITGDLNVTGTIDLSNANLNIGAADIIFGTVTGGATRGLIWDVSGGFLSKLIGGGADGGKVTLFANMGDAIISGNIFEIKDGSLGSLFLGLSHAGILTAGGGTSTQWNTAYNYSQAGHLPLAGGTLTGGLNVSSGNILIGTDSGDAFNGTAKLRIQQPTGPAYIQIKTANTEQAGLFFGDVDDDFTGGFIYANANDKLLIYTNNSANVAIDNLGQVGIGTLSPSRKLEVVGDAYVAGQFLATTDGLVRINQYDNGFNDAGEIALWAAGGTGWNVGDGLGRIRFYTNDGSGIGARDLAKIEAVSEYGNGTTATNASGALAFYTSLYNENVVENMRLSSDGNLSVVGSLNSTNALLSGYLKLTEGVGDGITFAYNGSNYFTLYYDGVNGLLKLRDNDDESNVIEINTSGDIDINPVGVLNVNGSVAATGNVTGANLSISNWNTAYTYSQDGHLPLSGGTLTGDLGVGISPTYRLHAYHPSTNVVATIESGDEAVHINLKDNASDTYGVLLSATGNDFHVSTGSAVGGGLTERLRILGSNGNVGIGTTTPGAKLHIATTDGDGLNITGGTNNRSVFVSTSNVDFRSTTTGGYAMGLRSLNNDGSVITSAIAGAFGEAGSLTYNYYGGTAYNNAAIYILPSKLVGIGTASPAAKLDVSGVIYSSGGTWNGGGVESDKTDVGIVIDENDFIYTRDDGVNLRKLIGKTNTDIIQIGESQTSLIDAINFYSGSVPLYRWYNNTSEIMRLNSTGLGIGTSSPVRELHVVGDGAFTSNLEIGYGSAESENWFQIGSSRTNNGYAYIDLIGDTTYSDYGLRIIRGNAGANSQSDIAHRGTGNLNLVTIDNASLVFKTYSEERMRITSTGNVGIGTTSPSYKLDVNGSAQVEDYLRITNSAGSQKIVFGNQDSAGVNNPSIIFAANGNTYIGGGNSWSGNGGTLDYTTTFLDNGNVGIGTTSPAYKLEVEGSIGVKRIGVAATSTIDMQGNFNFDAKSGYSHVFKQAGSELARILPSGNVGINTTSPSYKLDVQSSTVASSFTSGSGGYSSIRFSSTGGGAVGSLTTYVNKIYIGSENAGGTGSNGEILIEPTAENVLYLKSGGNVGIGTTSPAEKLTVNGTGNFTDELGAKVFRSNALGEATTSTSGWHKIGRINSRGGGIITLSFTGGDFTPVTYKINYYKNWSNTGTLKIEKYGNSGYISTARIRLDAADGLYYVEIYAVQATEFYVYHDKLLGYNATGIVYTGALAAGSASGTTISELPFVSYGTSVSTLYSGSIGIGETSLTDKFHIKNLSGDAGMVLQSGTQTLRIDQNSIRTATASPLNIFTNNTSGANSLYIASDGRFGIGTTAPTVGTKLDVAGTGRFNGNTAIITDASSGNYSLIQHNYNGAAKAFSGYNSGFALYGGEAGIPTYIQAGGQNAMVLLANGNVGIGETNPARKLTIKSASNTWDTAPQVAFYDSVATTDARNWAVGAVSTNYGDFNIASSTAQGGAPTTPRLTINKDGLVGIGTTEPSGKLSVEATGNHITLRAPGATAGKYWALDVSSGNQLYLINNAGTKYLTINDSGNVGVGVASPGVYGSGMEIKTGGQTGLRLSSTSTGGGAIEIGADSSTSYIQNVVVGDSTYFYTSNGSSADTIAMTLKSNGNVGIGVSSPDYKLSVEGGDIKLNHNNAAANYYLRLNKKEGQDGGILLSRDNTFDWQILNVGTSGDLWAYAYGPNTVAMAIKRSNAYVGIGTTSPATKLEVVETATSSGGVAVFQRNIDQLNEYAHIKVGNTSHPAYFGSMLGTYDIAYMSMSPDPTDGKAIVIRTTDGNVGIGTTSPIADGLTIRREGGDRKVLLKLDRPNTAGLQTAMQFTVDNIMVGQIQHEYAASNYNHMSFTLRSVGGGDIIPLWLENSGNVGIGTTSPAAKLDVGGNAIFRVGTGANNTGSVTIANDGCDLTVSPWHLNSTPILFINSQNTDTPHIGVNMSTADANGPKIIGYKSRGNAGANGSVANGDEILSIEAWPLHTGGPNYYKFGGGMTWYKDDGGGTANTYAPVSLKWVMSNSVTTTITAMTLTYNGNLSVYGSVTAGGDVYAYSDARVKENVETIDNALDKVVAMRGVSYNRIDTEDKTKKVGVIAQEIQKVLPEVVSEQEDGMLSVSYGNIVGVLIEAIKEQQKQIDELKAIINGGTK